ncbi:MAG: phage minor head protein [Gallionella sp.]|jgi:hypothetical protein
MNRILFDKPKHIDEVMTQFDLNKVSLVTKPNMYPMISGLETIAMPASILQKRKAYPVKRKMDRMIRSYKSELQGVWATYQSKMNALIGKFKEIQKMDYNNAMTIDRIAKIPFRYRKQFAEIADKYDLNLGLIDKIVINSGLMVNARYDNKKNLMEFNPDYLAQHGQIRIGDSGAWISETAKTFIHEFGHATYYNSITEEDRMAWQGLATFLQREQLTGDMNQYIVGEKRRFDGSTMYSPYYTTRDEAFVSVYARFNTREDFAECFLYYKVAPKTLERINPNKFQFMEAKVGDKIEKAYDPLDYTSDEQIFARNKIKERYAPALKDPKKTREEKNKIMAALAVELAAIAIGAYKEAFVFGKTKGAYHAGTEATQKISPQQKETYIDPLIERNGKYVDGLIEDVSNEYDDLLFTKDPYGHVTGVRAWESKDEFDQSINDVMDTQEHRLSLFAINGITLASMAGLTFEAGGEEGAFAGGFWHTHEDDKVCEGCNRLDGQWMTFEEFNQIYGDTDCDGNCRCGELFEPAPAPEGAMVEAMAHDRMHKLNCMCKGGGENAWQQPGLPGSTIKETNLNRFEKPNQKIVVCDYHGTIVKDNVVVEAMKAKLIDFKVRGFKIIIYSAGFNNNPSTVNGIETMLRENGIPFDEVWQRNGKPDADVYIDDKSFNPTTNNIESLQVTPEGDIKV